MTLVFFSCRIMGAKEFAFTALAVGVGVILATLLMNYIPQLSGGKSS